MSSVIIYRPSMYRSARQTTRIFAPRDIQGYSYRDNCISFIMKTPVTSLAGSLRVEINAITAMRVSAERWYGMEILPREYEKFYERDYFQSIIPESSKITFGRSTLAQKYSPRTDIKRRPIINPRVTLRVREVGRVFAVFSFSFSFFFNYFPRIEIFRRRFTFTLFNLHYSYNARTMRARFFR